MSLSVDISSTFFVGGQVLQGVAELHFPKVIEDALEEVHIKLRGSVFTKITRRAGKRSYTYMERLHIVHENVSLWNKGLNHYPPPGSSVLRIPFQFALPPTLPPSCQYNGFRKDGIVGYFVELVGVRNGLLSRNRRVRKPFSVVPPDPVGEQIAHSLRDPMMRYSFATASAEKNIRRGIFSEYSHVRIEISIPSVATYPLFTPIPFSLRIVTTTKPLKREKAEKHPNKPIFPAPPTDPDEIRFRLKQITWLKAQRMTGTGIDVVSTLGGFEKSTSPQPVNVQAREKQWVPSETDKGVGKWLQEVTFQSTFELSCSPAFQTQIMRVEYKLDMVVPFPGLGNDLQVEIPIIVTSGLSGAPMMSLQPGAAPPFMLALPPSYWKGADDWDVDGA